MIRVAVDPTNPGQFFACCGLLELADRLWPDAEGWFADGWFSIQSGHEDATLANLSARLQEAGLSGALTPELWSEREQLEEKKRKLKKERKALSEKEEARRKELGKLYREGNLYLGKPFNLLLDWWQSEDDAHP
jgi:CRISPR-associated protein Csb3